MDAHEESIKAAAIAIAGLSWVGASSAEKAVWMDHTRHAVRAYLTKRRETDGAVLTTIPGYYPEPSMHESAGVTQYAYGYNEAVSIVQHRADHMLSELENMD
jgi:hypothetical protein